MYERQTERREWMDAAAFDSDMTNDSFRFIEWINRFCGSYGIVWRFVRHEASRLHAERPLRVLDIGSGSCDIPMALCRRAEKRGVRLHVTCVEPNPHALKRARERLPTESPLPLDMCRETITEHCPDEPYDIAIASMLCHHFSDAEIVGLVTRLQMYVRRCLLINDLGRCWPNVLGAKVLTLPLSSIVRHDAVLSVKRGFLPTELRALLEPLPGVHVSCRWAWPCRVLATVRYEAAGSAFPLNTIPSEL